MQFSFSYYQVLCYVHVFVLPTFSIASIAGQSASNLPRQEQSSHFVRRFNHGSFILGETLYIDGGESVHLVDGRIDQTILNYTLAIDLSSSFSTSTNGNGVQIRSIDKGECPNFNFIRFWTDAAANTVYAYGGEFSPLNPWVGNTTVPHESLWSFTPNSDGGIWQSTNQSNFVFDSITRPSQGSVASGDIGGFNLGGYASMNTSQKTIISGQIPVPGLQFYNFTSHEWFNNSATAYAPHGAAVWSGMAYVPTWGPAGLVVTFGGQASPNISSFWDGAAYLSMSTISLFDPLSQSWYYQIATGDVPSQRDRFCTVGMNNAGNSTYEIFLYGGEKGNGYYHGSYAIQKSESAFDEVYILSLPSFVWFKANYTSSDPRRDHTCHVAGNRQMLSIGGVNPTSSSYQVAYNNTDPFWEGIKVFDLTDLQWTNYFNATAAPYAAPSAVAAHYATGSKYPSTWSNDDLKNLFLTPMEPSALASPQPKNTNRTGKTAIVVRGVAGGVSGLVLMTFTLYLVARIRTSRKTRKHQESKLLPTFQGGGPNPIESAPGAEKTASHELDSGQAWLREVDSGQYVPQEADSGHLYELSSRTGVGDHAVYEM